METFGVLLIAVDDYPDPPGPLPSSDSADRLAKLIVGERGGALIERVVAKSEQEITAALDKLANAKEGQPRSTIVYLVGHGSDDGVRHSFIVPADSGTTEIRTVSFGPVFEKDWRRRQADNSSWTLFVFDCCGAEIGLANLQANLSQYAFDRPRRLAMWPTAPLGASHSGRFVDALGRLLATLTENDAAIKLNEVGLRVLPELGALEPLGLLPNAAELKNPLHSPTPVVMNLDAYRELRSIIAQLPTEQRAHFVNKAQGTETGDLAWYFKGREKEIRTLSAWLQDAPAEMRVVTGAAGSGKSALLGHLSVLAEDDLVEAYAKTELEPSLRAGPRPPSSVFDATIHLTGKTLADVLDSIYAQVQNGSNAPLPDDGTKSEEIRLRPDSPDALISFLRQRKHVTVLADALDESQEPGLIARLLRKLVRSGVARVLVGTRRSLSEGPDQQYNADDNELIEALEARGDELVTLENDREATYSYVAQRLSASGTPYAGRAQAIKDIADRIASFDQPFLFAKLATAELLARPAMSLDDRELRMMLDRGHRGIFGAAVERITEQNPAVGFMLQALAFGRGRGLPEAGGTWLSVGQAIAGHELPFDAVQTTIDVAAPYITLDGEAGQSTYRLAHQTFVEHFVKQFDFLPSSTTEGAIATALLRLVDRSGGWATANYYWVRYLPIHLEFGMVPNGLDALVTNPAWLRRAVDLLGVDRVVDSISGGGLSMVPVANVIQKALRRCRIALSQDPGQLAGQMQARLGNNSDARLARLGSELAAESPFAALQMRRGHLDWMADLETTYSLVGQIRALAFGQVDGKILLAIGVEEKIHLWDPLQGSGGSLVFDNLGGRVTALAFSELDGRPVLVVAFAYDQRGMIINASTGEQIGESFDVPFYLHSLAMGLLGGRLAVVGSGNGELFAWDVRARAPFAPPEVLPQGRICGVFELEGRMRACVVRNGSASVADLGTGEELWPKMHLDGDVSAVAAGNSARDGSILAGYIDAATIVTWSPKEARELHRLDVRSEFPNNVPLRAFAFAEVDTLMKNQVVALGPDYDKTTLVKLCQLDSTIGKDRQRFDSGATWSGPEIAAVYASSKGTPLALTDAPLKIHDLTAGVSQTQVDVEPDRATIAFALTGRADSEATFASGGASALWRPPSSAPRGAETALRLDQPGEWPRSAWAWGQVGDRAVVATGSVAGAAWIWDVATGRPIAGPLINATPRVLNSGSGPLRKGSPERADSIALGRHPDHGDIVAVACVGRVRLFSLPDGREVPTPTDRATVIASVALGRIHDEDVLVTGSKGGVLIIWSLGSHARIAALTLDRGIDRVWVVHGADAIAARAASDVYVLDVVPGTETFAA